MIVKKLSMYTQKRSRDYLSKYSFEKSLKTCFELCTKELFATGSFHIVPLLYFLWERRLWSHIPKCGAFLSLGVSDHPIYIWKRFSTLTIKFLSGQVQFCSQKVYKLWPEIDSADGGKWDSFLALSWPHFNQIAQMVMKFSPGWDAVQYYKRKIGLSKKMLPFPIFWCTKKMSADCT